MKPHLLFLIFVVFAAVTHAQPFAADIRAFKMQDSLQPPPKNAILLIGSSSFTKWTDVQNYFPKKTIINRGFGGSTLEDVIRYADEIIFPYEPKQIIIYCGENDLASSKDMSTDTVVQRFKTLYSMIRSRLPKVSVLYIAMKPSPSRRQIFTKEMVANGEIRDFLEHEAHTYFIDIFYPMMAHGSEPNGSLFVSDSLHMNAKGYELWKRYLEPYMVTTKKPTTK